MFLCRHHAVENNQNHVRLYDLVETTESQPRVFRAGPNIRHSFSCPIGTTCDAVIKIY